MNTTHSSSPVAEVPAYAQLQREMHDALRAQHPDWILPNGDCPTCDSYDARFAELLTISLGTERAYEEGEHSGILRAPAPLRARDLDLSGNFSMPAEYAQPKKIIFPEMAPAIR